MTTTVRVLTLRYDPLLDAFDDAPLRELCKERRLVSVRDHFFSHEGRPRLAVVVHYETLPAAAPAASPAPPGSAERRAEPWRELLTPDDLPLFNTLREWRAGRARHDGVPPYVVCTNRDLALLVRARPQSLAKIGEVEGFGRGKLERFGADLLALLRRTAPDPAPPGPPTGAPEASGDAA